MKKIAILLTVYNRKECTLRCLQRLYEQKLPGNITFNVFITDGGSKDGTVESIKKIYPEINIQVKNGLFWNRGMYCSWEWAAQTGFDFYLWLNDDVYLYDNCITELLNVSSIYKDRAIIIGPTQSLNHESFSYGGYINKVAVKPNGIPQKIQKFNGNIVLVPQYVYTVIGNLDYNYIHSHGDFDYGYRAQKAQIEAFQTAMYLGDCDRHDKLPMWCNPEYPLIKRLKSIRNPTQYDPFEVFYYESKHFGILRASFHYITAYLRCIFPRIWILFGKAKI